MNRILLELYYFSQEPEYKRLLGMALLGFGFIVSVSIYKAIGKALSRSLFDDILQNGGVYLEEKKDVLDIFIQGKQAVFFEHYAGETTVRRYYVDIKELEKVADTNGFQLGVYQPLKVDCNYYDLEGNKKFSEKQFLPKWAYRKYYDEFGEPYIK